MEKTSHELIGKNADFTNGIYRDDYLRNLNDTFPVSGILKYLREKVSHSDNMTLTTATKDYLVENNEARKILQDIIEQCNTEGEWVGTSIRPRETMYGGINEFMAEYNTIKLHETSGSDKLMQGLRHAQHYGFVNVFRNGDKDKVYLLPTQKFVEFIKTIRIL
jgi:hypothetical protein